MTTIFVKFFLMLAVVIGLAVVATAALTPWLALPILAGGALVVSDWVIFETRLDAARHR
jgi:hypothetical protein